MKIMYFTIVNFSLNQNSRKKTVVSIYYKEKNRKLLVTSLNTNIMYIEENT